jgi:hypothetical protein
MSIEDFSLGQLILITVLYFGAVHRVTRLLTRDALPIIKVPRDAFVQRWGVYDDDDDRRTSINGKNTNIIMSSLAYLWECDWCASVWVAAGLGWLTWTWPHVMFWLLAGLAASSLTGTWAIVEKLVTVITSKHEEK